jgi:DNA mismatch endonuclease (patch repair protein)
MDNVDKETRSKVMAKVRSQNTRLEQTLFNLLIESGLSDFATHVKELLGKPDIVFNKQKLIVFLDSCYWHGCPKHLRMPSSNVDYWQNKIKRNKTRDRRQSSELKKSGWRVVRIWEHELKTPTSVVRKITRALKKWDEKNNPT